MCRKHSTALIRFNMAILICLISFFPSIYAAESVLNPEQTFGAEANPTGNPIGGGDGYLPIFTSGNYIVTSAAELIAALNKASAGEVVYIAPEASIDLTGRSSLLIRSGVTLAGNRGYQGSKGPLITCSEFNTNGLFNMAGAESRITGIRLQGPDGEIGPSAYFQPNSTAINVNGSKAQIDNNEIYNWSYGGVAVVNGAQDVYVHHNFIHHVRRNGLGYPVVVNKGTALIEANRFDFYRHAIASTGYIGAGYEARYNLVLPNSISHAFDMHGGADYCPKRTSGSCTPEEQYMAGEYVNIHHNTFMITSYPAIVLRGVPRQSTMVHNNWFYNSAIDQGFQFKNYNGGNTTVRNNVYGPSKRPLPLSIQPESYIRRGGVTGSGQVVAMVGRFSDAKLKLVNPSDVTMTRVAGNLSISVEFTAGKAQIQRVEFLVDGNLVYSGLQMPNPGHIKVDTRQLTDGVHRFDVKIISIEGDALQLSTTFRVENHWSISDELRPPVVSNWFGETFSNLLSNDAVGWGYAVDNTQSFSGDENRRVRVSPQAEPLIWPTPLLEKFVIVLYTQRPLTSEAVKLAGSVDGKSWSELRYNMRQLGEPSSGDWRALELTGAAPAGMQINQFQLAIDPSVPLTSIQVGRVELTGIAPGE